MIFPRTRCAATRRRFFLPILFWSGAVLSVQAAEIYKSIDADGHVVYSDHLDPALSQSTVVQLEESALPPRVLHFCWTNCFTLILDKGVYRRTDGTDERWTVETFSSKAIVLHRHDAPADWNGHSQDVVYAGQVAYDRLVDVTVNGQPVSGVDAAWGTALTTLPGSNAERDATTGANANASGATPQSGAPLESGTGPTPGATLSSAESPPPLPEEDQPPPPDDGYLWTPGYWYRRDQRYVWVPGAWLRPPQVGFLWTPAYWAVAGRVFVFHPGYWGPTVVKTPATSAAPKLTHVTKGRTIPAKE